MVLEIGVSRRVPFDRPIAAAGDSLRVIRLLAPVHSEDFRRRRK
jgi:hypothetical protein